MNKISTLIAFSLVLISSAHASTDVAVTRNASDVAKCTLVAQVESTGPYLLPGGDMRSLKAQARGLQADTVLVTVRSLVTRGVAYRCAQ